jgi:membrane-associated phospholipid phosphatase
MFATRFTPCGRCALLSHVNQGQEQRHSPGVLRAGQSCPREDIGDPCPAATVVGVVGDLEETHHIRAHRRAEAALGCAVGFLLLAGFVAAAQGPILFDGVVLRHTPGLASHSILLRLTTLITELGTPAAVVAATVITAALLSRRARTWRPLRQALPPLICLAAGVLAAKALLHRGGPPGVRLHHGLGYFPSGHTATALVCTGVLVGLLTPVWPHLRLRLVVASGSWTVVMAASLVYHRYHWFTDVLGGALLGGLILLVAPRGARHRPPRPARRWPSGREVS